MDCCSKIDVAHFWTSSNVSSSLGSNWNQNPQFLTKFRSQKYICNRLHLLEPFYLPKSSKMNSKTTQKCLVGTAHVGLGITLTTSRRVVGRRHACTSPQAAHFKFTWNIFTPHFRSLSIVLTSFPDQISLAKFNSQFVARFPVHNLQIRHHSTILALLLII